MKKSILILLLAAMGTAATAEWVKVESTDKFEAFVDPTTIRKNGNMAKMWAMHNYHSPLGSGDAAYMSDKVLNEYDCADDQIKPLNVVTYKKPMGTGDEVNNLPFPNLKYHVVPGTGGETMWKIACGKTKVK